MVNIFNEKEYMAFLKELDKQYSKMPVCRTSHLLFEEDYWDDEEDFDEEALNEMLTEMESGTSTSTNRLVYDEYEDDFVLVSE